MLCIFRILKERKEKHPLENATRNEKNIVVKILNNSINKIIFSLYIIEVIDVQFLT